MLEQTDVEPLHHGAESLLGSGHSETSDEAGGKIITTEEELQGFYIVKAILTGTIDLSRVVYRDVQSYFGILLDANNRKQVCRFYFNNLSSLKIVLFDHGDGDKQSEKISIASLDQIYEYADRIRATVTHYETKKSGGNAPQENVVQELAGVSG